MSPQNCLLVINPTEFWYDGFPEMLKLSIVIIHPIYKCILSTATSHPLLHRTKFLETGKQMLPIRIDAGFLDNLAIALSWSKSGMVSMIIKSRVPWICISISIMPTSFMPFVMSGHTLSFVWTLLYSSINSGSFFSSSVLQNLLYEADLFVFRYFIVNCAFCF